jgi:hypothetical protein
MTSTGARATSRSCCAATLLSSWVRPHTRSARIRIASSSHGRCSCPERHGALLQSDELSAFAPLRHDYEIAFHLRALGGGAAGGVTTPLAPPPAAAAAPSPLSAQTKNRRLAYLDTLDAAGFFDESAMRSRCVCATRIRLRMHALRMQR